jgi:hypothetical protein
MASSFAVISFDEHLGDNVADHTAPGFTFTGNQTSVRNFNISGIPVGTGYLIVQTFDVQNKGHRILVNGADLPGQDLVRTSKNRWQDVMDIIPEGFLRQGNNTIQILRASGGDNILIGKVAINWLE